MLKQFLQLFKRKPDFCIGGWDNPYLLRWWIIPRNRYFNIYLHKFLRDDDDRALHDHPWCSLSIILRGGYWEHLPVDKNKQKTKKVWRWPFIPYFRKSLAAHRIQLDLPWSGPVWTLFITGPRIREWGFWCPKGWVHWKDFTLPGDSSLVGKGCE